MNTPDAVSIVREVYDACSKLFPAVYTTHTCTAPMPAAILTVNLMLIFC